jgi:two-component system chemotaxis response regulator CheY
MMESALSLSKPYTLVISDWNMPVMAGIELLKNCRFHDTYERIPFIFITAENETEQVKEALKYKVDGYISKPFSQEKLISVISNALGQ